MRNPLEIRRGNRRPTWRAQGMDELFDRAFRDPFFLLDEPQLPLMTTTQDWFRPNFDVDETVEAYLLSVDLPGVKKEDLKIDMSGDVLTISGERKYERDSKEAGASKVERSYGSFQRSFTLPNSVEGNKIEAHLEDGVLRIVIPKSEQAKPRTIEIQAGRGGLFSKLIGSEKDKKEQASGSSAH